MTTLKQFTQLLTLLTLAHCASPPRRAKPRLSNWSMMVRNSALQHRADQLEDYRNLEIMQQVHHSDIIYYKQYNTKRKCSKRVCYPVGGH